MAGLHAIAALQTAWELPAASLRMQAVGAAPCQLAAAPQPQSAWAGGQPAYCHSHSQLAQQPQVSGALRQPADIYPIAMGAALLHAVLKPGQDEVRQCDGPAGPAGGVVQHFSVGGLWTLSTARPTSHLLLPLIICCCRCCRCSSAAAAHLLPLLDCCRCSTAAAARLLPLSLHILLHHPTCCHLLYSLPFGRGRRC